MTFNLSSLGDSCDSGVCLDTSAVTVNTPDPAAIQNLDLSAHQVDDLMSLPSGTQCYPMNFVGPIPPGSARCLDAVSTAPTVQFTPKPPTPAALPWGTLGLVLGGVLVLAMAGGGRRR